VRLALASHGLEETGRRGPAEGRQDRAARLSSQAIPFAIAGLVGVGLFATAGEAPLPALGWAAAFLFAAIVEDVRRLRIPNWLTFPSLALALALAFVQGGWPAGQTALIGAGAAFGLLFVPYCIGWLGAGDVKAIMVLGALWGPEHLLPVLYWMILAGGGFAVVLLVMRGGFVDLLKRWWTSLRLSLLARRPTYVGPPAGSTAAKGLPFAVAMGLGAIAFQLWGTPWS
jgi:prepilin peptidase CpaA